MKYIETSVFYSGFHICLFKLKEIFTIFYSYTIYYTTKYHLLCYLNVLNLLSLD